MIRVVFAVVVIVVLCLLSTISAAALMPGPTRERPARVGYVPPRPRVGDEPRAPRPPPATATTAVARSAPIELAHLMRTVLVQSLAATTTTSSTTTTTMASRRGQRVYAAGVEQWRDELAVFTDWNVDTMLAIMRCESGGNPNARNRSSGAAGLLQIYPAQAGSYDPVTNIAQAHAKWLASGYSPWVSSAGCW